LKNDAPEENQTKLSVPYKNDSPSTTLDKWDFLSSSYILKNVDRCGNGSSLVWRVCVYSTHAEVQLEVVLGEHSEGHELAFPEASGHPEEGDRDWKCPHACPFFFFFSSFTVILGNGLRQALYHLSHAFSPFCCSLFFRQSLNRGGPQTMILLPFPSKQIGS
jgi:hypothetical protein